LLSEFLSNNFEKNVDAIDVLDTSITCWSPLHAGIYRPTEST